MTGQKSVYKPDEKAKSVEQRVGDGEGSRAARLPPSPVLFRLIIKSRLSSSIITL